MAYELAEIGVPDAWCKDTFTLNVVTHCLAKLYEPVLFSSCDWLGGRWKQSAKIPVTFVASHLYRTIHLNRSGHVPTITFIPSSDSLLRLPLPCAPTGQELAL